MILGLAADVAAAAASLIALAAVAAAAIPDESNVESRSSLR